MRDNVVHRRHFLSYHNILFCQMYIFRSLLRTGYNRRAQCQRTDSSKIHGKNNDPFGRCIQDRGQSSGKTYGSNCRSKLIQHIHKGCIRHNCKNPQHGNKQHTNRHSHNYLRRTDITAANLSPINLYILFPRRLAIILSTSTASVVVFTPPAVPIGEPPTSIRNRQIITLPLVSAP